MKNQSPRTVYYHLPGLFEFYELYRAFLPLWKTHRDWFYDWCDIGSVYGAPAEAAGGYRFSLAMRNRAFIGVQHILETYLPMGFTNFKIEGRGLGSAVVLEFLLYYMTKPERQLEVRESIYLDSMLDLF